jgi:hypothetical protein
MKRGSCVGDERRGCTSDVRFTGGNRWARCRCCWVRARLRGLLFGEGVGLFLCFSIRLDLLFCWFCRVTRSTCIGVLFRGRGHRGCGDYDGFGRRERLLGVGIGESERSLG